MALVNSCGVREIEVKFRVADAESVAAALAARGARFSAPVCQDDQAYAPAGWAYGMSKVGVPFARLRTQDGRHLFTVKRPVDNAMVCVEHETTVADREQMHGAVLAMGFVPTVRIVKTRRTAVLGGVALCVDEVEHAGAFLEVETLVEDDRTGTQVQAELEALVHSLGVATERVTETYDSLVRAAMATT